MITLKSSKFLLLKLWVKFTCPNKVTSQRFLLALSHNFIFFLFFDKHVTYDSRHVPFGVYNQDISWPDKVEVNELH